MIEVNCILPLFFSFVSGCVVTAILVRLCNRPPPPPHRPYNSIPKAAPARIDIPQAQMEMPPVQVVERASKFTNELWVWPDEPKLPCWNYNDKLLGQSDRCQRFCDKHNQYLHTNERPSNLIRLMSALAGARHTIDICVFRFSLKETAKLLVRLKKDKGILVRAISDPGRVKDQGDDQIPFLIENGVEVREPELSNDQKQCALMHHKYAVIDGSNCFLGSFNWTVYAARYHNEAIVRTNDPVCVNRLMIEFERLWRTLPLAQLVAAKD